jgi:hypothetical protein
MPNPVAVNDLSPISGSLQTSRISYAVETAGKDYGQDYNGTTWYSDIPQNGSQYTIITDNYTANYYVSRSNAEGAYVEGGLPAVDEYSAPVFWLTAGTSSLDIITIVNGLPDRRGQIPFNSGSQALNWVASSSNYFAVGPPYEQIDTDQLALCLDASQIISYPTTASTWYDISGNTKNGTLTNGPTFDSNGWFTFDGVDDFVLGVSNLGISGNASLSISYFAQWDGATFSGDFPSGVGNNSTGTANTGLSTTWNGGRIALDFWVNRFRANTPLSVQKWYHVSFTKIPGLISSTSKLYVNGQEVAGAVEGTDTTPNILDSPFVIGRLDATRWFNGKISNTQIYNKALSAADVAQNYYGGPVVTGSISGSYYANNLVSYVTGSTNTYNLSANIISGSLQNGVGFSPLNGGYWSFDGSDDRILLEGSTTNAWRLDSTPSWTVNAWIRVPNGSSTSSGLTYQGILSNTSGGPIHSVFQVANSSISYSHYNNAWFTKSGTIPVNDGNWHMLTWVNSANSMNLYVDGKFDSTVNSTMTGAGFLDVIGSSLGTAFLGDIASLQINQGKAFTSDEVLQQYNATK